MMAFLSQVLAVEKTVKSAAYASLSELYKLVQKTQPFTGIERTYQPRDEENGEQLPRESVRVQVTGQDMLDTVADRLRKLFDVTADKDWANQTAKADVKVDGETILSDVPVTYLLFLEKQLTDIRTFVGKIPILDPSQEWVPADQPGVFRSARAVETIRTQKVPRALVMYPATDRHPAQVQPYNEDVPVGTWRKIDFSGALPAARVAEITERIEKLSLAVKYAREEGNKTEVPRQAVASKVFGYLFA
jgi:hypothetical protein